MRSKKRIQYASLMYNVVPFMIIGDSAMILTYIFATSVGISLIYIIIFNIFVFGIIIFYRETFFAKYSIDHINLKTYVFGRPIIELNWGEIVTFNIIFKYGSTYISFSPKVENKDNFEINLTNNRYKDLIKFCANNDLKKELVELNFSVFKKIKYSQKTK